MNKRKTQIIKLCEYAKTCEFFDDGYNCLTCSTDEQGIQDDDINKIQQEFFRDFSYGCEKNPEEKLMEFKYWSRDEFYNRNIGGVYKGTTSRFELIEGKNNKAISDIRMAKYLHVKAFRTDPIFRDDHYYAEASFYAISEIVELSLLEFLHQNEGKRALVDFHGNVFEVSIRRILDKKTGFDYIALFRPESFTDFYVDYIYNIRVTDYFQKCAASLSEQDPAPDILYECRSPNINNDDVSFDNIALEWWPGNKMSYEDSSNIMSISIINPAHDAIIDEVFWDRCHMHAIFHNYSFEYDDPDDLPVTSFTSLELDGIAAYYSEKYCNYNYPSTYYKKFRFEF